MASQSKFFKNGVKTTFTELRIDLKTEKNNNKTRFLFELMQSGLFRIRHFAVVVGPHFLNVVGRKRSGKLYFTIAVHNYSLIPGNHLPAWSSRPCGSTVPVLVVLRSFLQDVTSQILDLLPLLPPSRSESRTRNPTEEKQHGHYFEISEC